MIEFCFDQDSCEVGDSFSGNVIWKPERLKANARVNIAVGWRVERNPAWMPEKLREQNTQAIAISLGGVSIQTDLQGFRLSVGSSNSNTVRKILYSTKIKPLEHVKFTCKIPDSGPISYSGQLIKIIWEASASLNHFGCDEVNDAKSFQVIPRQLKLSNTSN